MAVKTPVIAIVGRPNVGKSTLFNRIVGSQKAVVEDIAGVTRDRNYSMVEKFDFPFMLVDTGGFEEGTEDELYQAVVEQVKVAIEEADLVLVLFDGNAGVHPGDHDLVDLIRRSQKPAFYVANKCDGVEQSYKASEFYALGLEQVDFVSAAHGVNVKAMVSELLHVLPNYNSLLTSYKSKLAEKEKKIKALVEENKEMFIDQVEEEPSPDYTMMYEINEDELDDIEEDAVEEEEPEFIPSPVYDPETDYLSAKEYDRENSTVLDKKMEMYTDLDVNAIEAASELDDEDEEEVVEPIECIRVAIVGRPNVGKSTLLNTLTGDQRAITSPISGTTRDSLDVKIRREGQDYLIVDTAGLRKKARVSQNIEKYSTIRAINALNDCDVAVVVLDGNQGASEQDTKILGLAHEYGKGVVIVVNKWDEVEKDHRTVVSYTKDIREAFKFAPYAPIVFTSALTGKRCPKVIQEVRKVAYQRQRRIPTGRLNRLLKSYILKKNLPFYRGNQVKIYFGAQVDTAPPRFALFSNYPKAIHFSYMRYLKNAFRREFGFEGSDIKLVSRKR